MRRILFLFILLSGMLATFPAWSMLRTLGTAGQMGLYDENVLHIAIVLEDCEWEAVISQDGGQAWSIEKKEKLPAVLGKLPASGQIRYTEVEGRSGVCLIRSDNGGQTWQDVSPRNFLIQTIRNEVDAEKKVFLESYGHWLPDEGSWALVFGGSALLLFGCGAIGFWREKREWILPLLLSLMSYFIFCIGLFFIHQFYIQWMCSDQWTTRLAHWDRVAFPMWPLGMWLNLTGRALCAPVMALLFFPLTPMFGALAGSPSTTGRTKLRAFIAIGAITILGVLMLLSALPGIGHGPG